MGDDAIFEQMLATDFFEGMKRDHLEFLASVATSLEVSTEHYFFRQDARAEHFFLLLEGEVSVEVPAVFGQPLVMQTLRAGDVLGWSWLLPPYRWHFDARAISSTRALAFDGGALRKRCEDDFEFGYRIATRFASLMQSRLEAARLRAMDYEPP